MKRKSRRQQKKGETGFDKLARLVKSESDDIRITMDRRFSSVEKRFDGLDKRFDGVDKHFDEVEKQLREIRAEIVDIRERVERLEERGAIQAGYAKEIDHILERVTRIERHIGIVQNRKS